MKKGGWRQLAQRDVKTSAWLSTVAALVAVCATSACGTGGASTGHRSQTAPGNAVGTAVIRAVGAENEYADVIRQIGGPYVSVSSIMSNPSVDPHTYEASTNDAKLVGMATLVVQNGLGYDDFMGKLESASPNSKRTVIDVAKSLGDGSTTKNPHLWYLPNTMPRVAQLIANALAKQDPAHASYFQQQLKTFDQSLQTWDQALARVKQTLAHTPVAVTEPIADYLLQAAGMDIKTPWSFEAAVMKDVDPSPQDVAKQENLFKQHAVKVFVYNQQAMDDVTIALLKLAKQNHIPVVGVYETMPPHHTYQTWMEAETKALQAAIEHGTSTETMS